MDYVTWANIHRFNGIIAGDLDPGKRRILVGLLADEKAKLTGETRAAQAGCAEAAGGGECKTRLL